MKRSQDASIEARKSSENYFDEEDVVITPVRKVKGKRSFYSPIVDIILYQI